MKHSVLSESIHSQVEWIRRPTDYNSVPTQNLQEQNKKVLQTLKLLEQTLDKELELQKKNVLYNNAAQSPVDQLQLAIQNIKNNDIRLSIVEKEVGKLRERRNELKNGLQSKLHSRKYDLERRVAQCVAQLKQLKLEETETNKRLSVRGDVGEPQLLTEHTRLEQDLRSFSLRYVKLLDKHNRISEQLAQSNLTEGDLSVPEELINHELEQKEEEQYQEYQGIVKLSTILAKRNDSENGKLGRIYSQKLKELERSIVTLGEIDRAIEQKETELLEGKKNLELIKFKIGSREEGKVTMPGEGSSWRKSYSTSRLPIERQASEIKPGKTVVRKLSRAL